LRFFRATARYGDPKSSWNKACIIPPCSSRADKGVALEFCASGSAADFEAAKAAESLNVSTPPASAASVNIANPCDRELSESFVTLSFFRPLAFH